MTDSTGYTAYYPSCYQQYTGQRSGPAAAAHIDDLPIYRFSAEILDPGQRGASSGLILPHDWNARVTRLAASAAAALDQDARILQQPTAAAVALDPARRLANPLGLDGLEDVVETLVGQLEATLYGCHVAVDKVHVYRQLAMPSPQCTGGSWVWHADGHPSEFIKALVYLGDVDESCSAFELLWSEQRGRALRCVAAPMHEHNWLSGEARSGAVFDADFITHWNARGYRRRSVHGAAGTTILFATNCVHRGTLGAGKARDTLGLRLRPSASAQHPRLQVQAAIERYALTQPFAA